MGQFGTYAGTFVKLFKDKILLSNTARILTGTADPTTSATDGEKGSIYLRQNASGDGELYVKLDAGSTTAWRKLLPSTLNTVELIDKIDDSFNNAPYNLMTRRIAEVEGNADITHSGSSLDVGAGVYLFPGTGQFLVAGDLTDAEEFQSNYNDIQNIKVQLHWKSPSLVDTAAIVNVSRDGGAHYSAVTMTRDGANSPAYSGEFTWPREEENANNAGISAPDTSSFEMNITGNTKVGGLIASTTLARRVTSLGAYLNRTATSVAGNYRLALYSDSTGPSVLLFATAWQPAASVPTGMTLMSVDVSSFGISLSAGVNYWLVLETDAAYQADFNSTNRSISWHYSGSGTNQVYTNNGTTWTVSASKTLLSSVVAWSDAPSQNLLQSDLSVTSNVYLTNSVPVTKKIMISTRFVLTSKTAIRRADVMMRRVGATLTGSVYAQIRKNNAGNPSDNPTDILAVSQTISAQSLPTSLTQTEFDFPVTVLPPGTYHLVFATDDTYKDTTSGTGFLDGFRQIEIGYNGNSPGGSLYDGTAWSGSVKLAQAFFGRVIDLRLRIASVNGGSLSAFTVMYQPDTIVGGNGSPRINKKTFQAVADNTSTFTLSWLPDPALLNVYHVESGRVYRHGAFSLQGQSVVFATNFFYNGGVENPVTLIFSQVEASSYDNSDRNAALLAANHLGSTDGTIDRSVPGRGVLLRRPDGTLREITINDQDQIEVYSV